MIFVKTKVEPSPIHGLGLFADECIPKGTKIWELTEGIDKTYSKEEAEALAEPERSEILSLHYSYISKYIGKYILCGDDNRFMNHSDMPNTAPALRGVGQEPDYVAARDIAEGEEITCDYRDFDEEIAFEIREAYPIRETVEGAA